MPDLAELMLVVNSSQVQVANNNMNIMVQVAGQAEVALKQLKDSSDKQDESTKKANSSFNELLKTIGALAGAYLSFQTVRDALSNAAVEDRLEKGFTNLTGSVDKAKDTLAQLINFSTNSQFNLAGLGEAERQFIGLGVDADAATKLVITLGTTLENLGSGSDSINQISNSLTRMLEMGQANMYTFRALGTQGIPAVQYVADALGVSLDRAMFLLRNGAISGADAIKILQAGLDKFNQNAKDTEPTYTQLWASLTNTIKLGLGGIAKDIMDALNIKTGLNDILHALQNFGHVVSDTIRIFEGLPPKFTATADGARMLAGIIKIVGESLAALAAIRIITWASDVGTALFNTAKGFANLGVFSQAAVVSLVVLGGIEIGRWASEQYAPLAKLAAVLRLVGSFSGSQLTNLGEWIADKYMGDVKVGTDSQNAAERAQHSSTQDAWDQFDKTMQQINAGNLGGGQGKTFFTYVADDIKRIGSEARTAIGPIKDLMKFSEYPTNMKQGDYGGMPQVGTTLPESAQLELQRMIDNVNEQSAVMGVPTDWASKMNQMHKMQEILDKYNTVPGMNTAQSQAFLDKLSVALDKLQGLKTLDVVAKSIGDSFANAFGQFITGAKNAQQAALQFVQSLEQMLLKDLVLKNLAQAIEGGLTGVGAALFGGGGGSTGTATTLETGQTITSGVYVTQARGGVWNRGIRYFAQGDVISSPTMFSTTYGTGVMGEAGPEAVMPLTRGPNGKLGVAAAGGGGVTHNHYWNISTPNADSFRRSARQVASIAQRAVGGR